MLCTVDDKIFVKLITRKATVNYNCNVRRVHFLNKLIWIERIDLDFVLKFLTKNSFYGN